MSLTLSTIRLIAQINIWSLFSTMISIILWNLTSLLNRRGLHSFRLFKCTAGVNISIDSSERLNIQSAHKIASFKKLLRKKRMRFLIYSRLKKKNRNYHTQSQKIKRNRKIKRLRLIWNLQVFNSIYKIKKNLKKSFWLMYVVILK